MAVYGYARISRDEDNTNESIEGQINIIKSHAKEKGWEIEEIYSDNNFSGYTFDRPKFNVLREILEKGDKVIVKDLSRVGRHNALTLLFLEELTKSEVGLISIGDGLDLSIGGNDDMIVGVKTWFNELYVKDISKKVRQSLQNKLKNGMVLIPHFGFMKDENGKVVIDEEAAMTVRKIFELYIDGYGFKKIAEKLTEMKYKTPAIHKAEKFGIGGNPTSTRHLWSPTSVGRLIKNDAYIGNHRTGVTESKTIKGLRKRLDKDQHLVHENFFPPIIEKEVYDLAQEMLAERIAKRKRGRHDVMTLYSGMLKCGVCGSTLVARKSYAHKPRYYECGSYHRYGNKACGKHKIYEHEITEVLIDEIRFLVENADINLEKIDKAIKNKNKMKHNYDQTLTRLRDTLEIKKDELKKYSRQLAKDLIDEELFVEVTTDVKNEMNILKDQIKSVSEVQSIDGKLKENFITSKEILEDLVDSKELTSKDIHILLDKVVVHETSEVGKWGRKKVDLEVNLRAPFVYHKDTPTWANVPLWLINFNDNINSRSDSYEEVV